MIQSWKTSACRDDFNFVARAFIVGALVVGAGVAMCSKADAASSTWCSPRGCWTRTYFTSAPVMPAVQNVEPEATPADEAARAVRIQKWEALCQPSVVVGADGISRYQYALPGCDTGRTQ